MGYVEIVNIINKKRRDKNVKEKSNREILEQMGEGCSYNKTCEECEVKEKCKKDIDENYKTK